MNEIIERILREKFIQPEEVDLDVTELTRIGDTVPLIKKITALPHLCHQQNEIGDFLAHSACRFARNEVIMILGRLKYNFNVDFNSEGFLPIHVACRYGHVDCVLALRLCGANLNATTESDLNTPLHIASKLGSVMLIKVLLRAKVKRDAQDSRGYTPYMIAVTNGHFKAAELLFDRKHRK